MSQSATYEVERTARATGGEHIVAWVERTLGGRVVAIERLARWRPGWRLELERGGEILHLYARGDRGPDFPAPFSLDHELGVHELLEAHGLPVPHVYGLVSDGGVRTLVMDSIPGQQGLALAANDDDRRSLLLECVDLTVRIHKIEMDEVACRGFTVPSDPVGIAMSEAISNVERIYLSRPHPMDPVVEFLRGWLRRNLPGQRTRPAFVLWDAAQFLHEGGRLTALIDFELAHVGDPYMDLAPLRSRDTIEPLGDLSTAFGRYAEMTDEAIDFELLRYYEISQLTTSIMLAYCTLTDPDPETDLVSTMTWYSDSAWFALEVMAELHGTELEAVEVPEPRRSRHAKAHQHLVTSLRRSAGRESRTNLVRFGIDVDGQGRPEPVAGAHEDFAGWRNRCDYRLARHLRRVDEIGAELESQDLSDVAALVGRGHADLAEADAALLGVVEAAGAESDGPLLDLFGRRIQRVHMLLGPADSLVVRHPKLQPMPARWA